MIRDLQRALGTVFVVILIIFAGCGGIFDNGNKGPAETLTPAPVPTDEPTPTPVPELAPGLKGNGIENMSVLVAVSKSFFQNRTFTGISTTKVVASNGSVLSRTTGTLRAGPAGEGFTAIYKSEGKSLLTNERTDPARTEVWWNGKQFFEKQTYVNGTTTYNRLPINDQQTGFGYATGSIALLPSSLGINDTTVAERLTRNGMTLYRIYGTVPDAQWGNKSFQLLVDSNGIIHEFTIVSFPSIGDIGKIVMTEKFSKIGMTDTPKQPSWADKATNQTTPIPEGASTPTMPSIQLLQPLSEKYHNIGK